MKQLRPDARPSANYAVRLLILAGLLVGLGMRLFHLGGESFWYDETVSVHLARLPLPAMLAHTAGDIHPPGYYALLHVWQALTQPSLAHGLEFLFAWPSLLLGMLALPLLYAIGRRLFGVHTALVALLLAALNPFQVWYSQEVRMYTLGAALGLLCLWAVLQFAGSRRTVEDTSPHLAQTRRLYGWLAAYVLAAAAGLYTLYYFLFLLVALNLVALLLLWLYANGAREARWRQTFFWVAAQFAVLLLWLPWLPVFWGQATDPPVPPWRAPWDSAAALLHSTSETLAALLVGQTPPSAATGPWAIVTVLLLVGMVVLSIGSARRQPTAAERRRTWLHVAIVIIYVFVPTAILFAVTLLGSPIYHVRYLALYAPLFALIPAWLLVHAWRQSEWLAAAMWAGLLAASALSLLALWTSPLYRADNHRQAVADLARAWRPGDAILANAGWIYPVLTTYWPGGPAAGSESAPPALEPPLRIVDYAQDPNRHSLAAPLLIRTGSVDAPPSLGWNDPNSDFFAVSSDDTRAALATLAEQARRIWHYRMYDTVSDPHGAIRSWLDANTALIFEQPIPGRDFGLLQLFATKKAAATAPSSPPLATFGGALDLLAVSAPPTVASGSYLYVDLLWLALPPLAVLPADLSASLRLYDGAGSQVAQADGPLSALPTRAWATGTTYAQAAALPVPVGLMPGKYTLQLIVYSQTDAAALPIDGEGQQMWELAALEVLPQAAAP